MSLSSAEKKILSRIHVRSENDPRRPEFPADDPKFPATPTYKIKVHGFTNVWLKDESYNPTGTHKDRMAWEIVVTYRHFLLAKKNNLSSATLPQMSIISSGSAAVAIQTQLNKYGLPNLKVLVDTELDANIVNVLEKLGCEIFQTDLSRAPLSWSDILALTHNPDGFDITSSEALDPATRFYDWLSYEVINQSPEYCFIPFGTGTLYENILGINKREVSTSLHDPRYKGRNAILRRCHFLGATTNDPSSSATKLYSPHLPFVHFNEQSIKLYQYSGFCGAQSGVHAIQERYLEQAMQVAERNNVRAEPSGLAGLALLLQLGKKKVTEDAKILVVSTGYTKYPK
ncbi:MAG: pyridoxal-phosphate dependent enzyme [Candidatus Andersenbacteria bacterium]